MYYDAAGRLVRTELPDGTFSRVDFTPWQAISHDAQDTVLDSRWYIERSPPNPERPLPINPVTGNPRATPDERAAWLAALHHGTPSLTALDSLGRDVVAIAHNRVENPGGAFMHGGKRYVDEKYATFTRLDAEGKPLWIRDARGNLVMQYIAPQKATTWAAGPDEAIPAGAVPCYDIAGNLLFQHSMDAGDRWMLMDSTGQPFYAWDFNDFVTDAGVSVPEARVYHTIYDELHRPRENRLSINGGIPQVVERFVYGETVTRCHRTQPARSVAQALRPERPRHQRDLRLQGQPANGRRQLAAAYQAAVIHWPDDASNVGLAGRRDLHPDHRSMMR